VCNDLTVENQVAAQLLGGAVNGDNRMRMGVLDKGQKMRNPRLLRYQERSGPAGSLQSPQLYACTTSANGG